MTHVWLRAESKPLEERTALTPDCARALVEAGFQVTVEDSSQNCFATAEYETAGCQLAAPHSWKTDAPDDAFILGLKELASESTPLRHRHIHFAHVYKDQRGWQDALNRFSTGAGTLFDLEFLVDDDGRRVAAFGYWAGFAGAALALLSFARTTSGAEPLSTITSRDSQEALVQEVQAALDQLDKRPSVIVMGALGRSGRGAVKLCKEVGAEVTEWDLAETKRGGPFNEIIAHDVLLNCVFVQRKIPPFVTPTMLSNSERQLQVICDISCDPYGEYNPLPIYDTCTTFERPTLRLQAGPPPLDLIAIDHLPSLLPRESSEDFCQQLLPYLMQLCDTDKGVWGRAANTFHHKSAAAKADSIRQET